MQLKQKHDVGVIVGRFQVHDLHAGHVDLIQTVVDTHDKVVIFLGLSPLKVTPNNPLDFEMRRQMIQEMFPRVNVLYIKDVGNDEAWSRKLDEMVSDLCSPGQSVCLYGGRDSFIERYHGRYATEVLEADQVTSATSVRRSIARSSAKQSPDFRAGVIWAASGTFPTAYPAVDIAVLDSGRLLVGKKPNETAWRLPGGFVDPADRCLEEAAKREALEETGIEVGGLRYVCSQPIDDWRYRGERDIIMSILFTGRRTGGHLEAADDLAEVAWLPTNGLDIEEHIVPNHRPLVAAVLEGEDQ